MEACAAVKNAYARLGRLTPIQADCGKLCRKRCCKGGNDDGMILFPGEETPASFAVYDRDIAGYPVRFAVCKGRCRREARPLSCRVFPFAPYLGGDGALSVIPDPRAKYICPLLTESALPYIDPGFLRAALDAFGALLEAAETRPMLEAYSRMLDEYRRFTG